MVSLGPAKGGTRAGRGWKLTRDKPSRTRLPVPTSQKPAHSWGYRKPHSCNVYPGGDDAQSPALAVVARSFLAWPRPGLQGAFRNLGIRKGLRSLAGLGR